MDIISILFSLLSIVSIFVFYIIPLRYRMVFLTIISCGFILSYHFLLLLYVLLFSLINFLFGKLIPDHPNNANIFRMGLILNLLQLVVLKYSTFVIDPLFSIFGSDLQVSKLSQWIIPLGISYFTLQSIGYLVNIKMGWEKPERVYSDFLLYIIFYPKFVSGPIERSNHFIPQIKQPKQFNQQMVGEGIRLALFGFFKKVVIANNLGSIVTFAYSD